MHVVQRIKQIRPLLTMVRQDGFTYRNLTSLLAAWVTMVFGTSALLFLFSPVNFKTYSSNSFLNFFLTTWEIADEVGPIVKISIIAVFALLVMISARFVNPKMGIAYLLNAVLGIIANGIVLGFLPQSYSRGFGIGLTGIRFDPQTLPIYLVGSILGGLVYSYALNRSVQK